MGGEKGRCWPYDCKLFSMHLFNLSKSDASWTFWQSGLSTPELAAIRALGSKGSWQLKMLLFAF
jgi:hypothetical protein